MAADNRFRDESAEGAFGHSVRLDGFQRIFAQAHTVSIVRIELGHACVEIPAYVVESLGVSDGLYVLERAVLDVQETDDDIRHLDSGVVDIVLDLDELSLITKRAHEGVTECGGSQVADVGRLVGIDVGVLDDDFATRRAFGLAAREKAFEKALAIEKDVEVARTGDFDSVDSVNGG